MSDESTSGPAVRQGWILGIVMSVLGVVATAFSAWAATSLQELKEHSIRQEGANLLVQSEISGLKDRIQASGADRYTGTDASRDRAVLDAVLTGLAARVGVLEARRR